MASNNIVFNRLFTQYAFKDMIEEKNYNILCSVIKRISVDPECKSNGEIISEIYKVMSKNYRNEYFYQNTLLNKLLFGKHSPKTTTALTQIPIDKSKADFILINGKAVVYEIKSELDSFDRLGTQLNDYYKAFNHVCVVTAEKNYEKIMCLLHDTPVGVYILTSQNKISRTMKKEPKEENSFLDHKAIFKLLHKNEFENIITVVFKKLPSSPAAFYYDECFALFSKIPVLDAYTLALKELKKRNKIIIEKFSQIPYELRSLMYFSNSMQKDSKKLYSFLQNKFRS